MLHCINFRSLSFGDQTINWEHNFSAISTIPRCCVSSLNSFLVPAPMAQPFALPLPHAPLHSPIRLFGSLAVKNNLARYRVGYWTLLWNLSHWKLGTTYVVRQGSVHKQPHMKRKFLWALSTLAFQWPALLWLCRCVGTTMSVYCLLLLPICYVDEPGTLHIGRVPKINQYLCKHHWRLLNGIGLGVYWCLMLVCIWCLKH